MREERFVEFEGFAVKAGRVQVWVVGGEAEMSLGIVNGEGG